MSAKPKEVSASVKQAVRENSVGEEISTIEVHETPSENVGVVGRLKTLAKELGNVLNVTTKRFIHNIQARLPPKKLASKTYRYLARQLVADLADIEGAPKIVFSSTDDLDANSEVLLMLAYFLQDEVDCKVLLVDGTLSKGGISDYLGVQDSVGFTGYFLGVHRFFRSMIVETKHKNISVMPAGTTPALKHLNFERSVLESQLKSLELGFDYVFIQQDGILKDSRYLDINKLSDLVLLLVAERKTRLSELEAYQKAYEDHMIHQVKMILSE